MASQSLLNSAARGIQVVRRGEVTLLIFDGQGALVTTTLAWRMAERWGSSRMSTGNMMRDRSKLLERVDPGMVRTGTSVAVTHGNTRDLLNLAKSMTQAGLDLKEWRMPPAVIAALKPDEPDEDDDADDSAPDADGNGPDDTPTPGSV